MKTIKWFTLLSVVISLGLLSCSKDENNQAEEIEGQKAVAWIKSQVIDESGELIFITTDVDGVYVFGVDNKQIAHSLCAGIIDSDFEGDNYKYILPDKKGEIIIRDMDQDGHYYTIDFKVKEIPVFQLKMMHPQAIEDENMVRPQDGGYVYYECTKCKRNFSQRPKHGCPNQCGAQIVSKHTHII